MSARAALTFIASLAALSAAPVYAAPGDDAAQSEPGMDPDPGVMDDAMGSAMESAMAAIGSAFETEPLTPTQEARLPMAKAVVHTMLPEGFYTEMMDEMMDGIMGPLMGVMNGDLAATGVLASRLSIDEATLQALSPEDRIELARMLDPGFADRGAVMQGVLGDAMAQAAVVVEPLFRDGLSRAYAVKFDETQLADIAAFFDTPTGAVFATQNMALMADPQVMSASMQAMPAMLGQMSDMTARVEEAFAGLPMERGYSDFSPAERERISALTGIAASELEAAILPPADSFDGMSEPADTEVIEDNGIEIDG